MKVYIPHKGLSPNKCEKHFCPWFCLKIVDFVIFWSSWFSTILPKLSPTRVDPIWDTLPLTGKNTGIILVPCCLAEVCPLAISVSVSISEVCGCHLLWQRSSQWGSQKLLQLLLSHEFTTYLSVFNLFLTQWIMAYYQKIVNQITLNHTTL